MSLVGRASCQSREIKTSKEEERVILVKNCSNSWVLIGRNRETNSLQKTAVRRYGNIQNQSGET